MLLLFVVFQKVERVCYDFDNNVIMINQLTCHGTRLNCREKVEIPATMAYITLEGAGADKTIIEWDDTADRLGQSGQPLGTYGSATFAVNSPYFIAKNITFQVSATTLCSSVAWMSTYLTERSQAESTLLTRSP